jgi:hypothetical protein
MQMSSLENYEQFVGNRVNKEFEREWPVAAAAAEEEQEEEVSYYNEVEILVVCY